MSDNSHQNSLPTPHEPSQDGTCCWLQQSPINIVKTYYAPELPPIMFQYQQGTGTFDENDPNIVFPPGSAGGIVFEGHKCALLKLHFHRRSEHWVNGQDADLELHLVHRHPAYPDFAKSAYVAVGVFLDIQPSPKKADAKPPKRPQSLAGFLRSLPAMKIIKDDTVTLDPSVFLPDPLPDKGYPYFRYEGSLTSPPYTELFNWVVLRDHKPLPNSNKQSVEEQTEHKPRLVRELNRRFVLRNFQ